MYLLLDANVTAGFYLPYSLDSANARKRIEILFNSVRTGGSDHFLYIPNFCIAEVFSVFAKHSFGKWNRHVKRKGTIDTRVYSSLVKQFGNDIHNGSFLYQYELSRYHVLGIDLVAPVDHHFQLSRGRKRRHVPAGTFDHLIISMGIQLAHIHGAENVAVVTADRRLVRILEKCRQGIPARTVKKLKLDRAEAVADQGFSPAIFPRFADLVTGTKADMQEVFGAWPLPVNKMPKVYRWKK